MLRLKVANMSKDISDFATVEIIDIFDQTRSDNWWFKQLICGKIITVYVTLLFSSFHKLFKIECRKEINKYGVVV